MPERSKHGLIRRKMWLAHSIKVESAFNYKFPSTDEPREVVFWGVIDLKS
jgi:hypothetical protein